MKKLTLLFFLFWVGAVALYAQDSTKVLDGLTYKKYSGEWYLYDLKSKDTFLLNDKIVTVKFKTTVTNAQINSFLASQSVTVVGKPVLGWYNLDIGSAYIFSKYTSIKKHSYIKTACLQPYGKFFATPSDSLYSSQWYLQKIKMDSAWDISTGDSNIIIAVLDNGYGWSHRDLGTESWNWSISYDSNQYENLWRNYSENDWTLWYYPQSGNGIDNDDFDGDPSTYIDDWKGWRFSTFAGIPGNDIFPMVDNCNPIEHGSLVSGIISAKTNNFKINGVDTSYIGIAGVAGGWQSKGCTILPCVVGNSFAVDMDLVPEAIMYAVHHNAKVINMSFGGPGLNPAVADALDYAYNHGVVLIAASGNTNSGVGFPASYNKVIAVGGTDASDHRALFTILCNTDPNLGSSYGQELDLSAPCTNILSTTRLLGGQPTGYAYVNGTSFAAPQVTGVAGLCLSTNPCLSNNQVYEILRYTSDKTGGYNYNWNNLLQPGHSLELGYGRLNAYKAVKTAQAMKKNTLDLYMKDRYFDFGIEPNTDSSPFWISTDIWVRNQIDTVSVHENPTYNPSNPVYVNVRIRNKSCVNYNGSGAQLKVYWAKSSTGVSWPNPWNDVSGNPQQGGIIGAISIPALAAGKDTVLRLTWNNLPNPGSYPIGMEPVINDDGTVTIINNSSHHYCLLARIESASDPMFAVETSILGDNVRKNNNIIQKNISIMGSGGEQVNLISLGNLANLGTKAYNLNLLTKFSENGKIITNDAKVFVRMDSVTWDKWKAGGKIMGSINATTGAFTPNKGISVRDSSKFEFLVTDPNVCFKNLSYAYNTQSRVAVYVNFKGGSSADSFYTYNLVQTLSSNNSIVGGVELQIHRPRGTGNKGVALGSLEHNDILKLYPNPVSGILHYELKNDATVERIVIINMEGKVIESLNGENQIDVSTLASGTYLITLFTNMGEYSEKFVKQ